MKAIAYGLPFELDSVRAWKARENTLLETHIHKLLAERRLRNEWFSLEPKEVEHLADLMTRLERKDDTEMWNITPRMFFSEPKELETVQTSPQSAPRVHDSIQ